VVAVVAAALEAQIDGGYAGLHRPGGPLAPGIRRKGQSLSVRQILSLSRVTQRSGTRFQRGYCLTCREPASPFGVHVDARLNAATPDPECSIHQVYRLAHPVSTWAHTLIGVGL
jgi:hypothetical protein